MRVEDSEITFESTGLVDRVIATIAQASLNYLVRCNADIREEFLLANRFARSDASNSSSPSWEGITLNLEDARFAAWALHNRMKDMDSSWQQKLPDELRDEVFDGISMLNEFANRFSRGERKLPVPFAPAV